MCIYIYLYIYICFINGWKHSGVEYHVRPIPSPCAFMS